jgi:hypothetical protein
MHVHAVMDNPDDLAFLVVKAIEEDVTSDQQAVIAASNILAISPELGIVAEMPDSGMHRRKVTSFLPGTDRASVKRAMSSMSPRAGAAKTSRS